PCAISNHTLESPQPAAAAHMLRHRSRRSPAQVEAVLLKRLCAHRFVFTGEYGRTTHTVQYDASLRVQCHHPFSQRKIETVFSKLHSDSQPFWELCLPTLQR